MFIEFKCQKNEIGPIRQMFDAWKGKYKFRFVNPGDDGAIIEFVADDPMMFFELGIRIGRRINHVTLMIDYVK